MQVDDMNTLGFSSLTVVVNEDGIHSASTGSPDEARDSDIYRIVNFILSIDPSVTKIHAFSGTGVNRAHTHIAMLERKMGKWLVMQPNDREVELDRLNAH